MLRLLLVIGTTAPKMASPLYEPINVYKPLAPDIGIVDGPFEYLTASGVRVPLPFTTRMTVVRLSNGELFLHSPIKFDRGLAEELREFGTIRHLVSPNQFHYAHIGEWQKAFPEAIAWASPRVRQRARARQIDVDFARDLDLAPPQEGCRGTASRRCSLAAISRSSFSAICRRRH